MVLTPSGRSAGQRDEHTALSSKQNVLRMAETFPLVQILDTVICKPETGNWRPETAVMDLPFQKRAGIGLNNSCDNRAARPIINISRSKREHAQSRWGACGGHNERECFCQLLLFLGAITGCNFRRAQRLL